MQKTIWHRRVIAKGRATGHPGPACWRLQYELLVSIQFFCFFESWNVSTAFSIAKPCWVDCETRSAPALAIVATGSSRSKAWIKFSRRLEKNGKSTAAVNNRQSVQCGAFICFAEPASDHQQSCHGHAWMQFAERSRRNRHIDGKSVPALRAYTRGSVIQTG